MIAREQGGPFTGNIRDRFHENSSEMHPHPETNNEV
jgi:hypothetical protein